MLQYDNSAFYFFFLSTISFYLAPSWYFILSCIKNDIFVDDAAIGAVARTEAEKVKAEHLKARQGLSSFRSTGFLVNLAITVALSIIFIGLLYVVEKEGQGRLFEPFMVLGIDPNADKSTIRKAYLDLAPKLHPDKNRDDPEAEAKFILLKKAYDALKDKAARKLYDETGQWDGNQRFEVGIGLPDFLVDGRNRNLVLIVYLMIIVGVIPFAVWKYYSVSSKYGEKDVMYDTYSWYYHCLNQQTTVKTFPEVLAGSAEFRSLSFPKDYADNQAIVQLATQVREHMMKPKYSHPVCVKGNVLLHAHLLRKTALLNSQQQSYLQHMLQMSSTLIDAMISVCKNQDALQTVATCIEFGQCVTQAMWIKDSPLLQMPHFTLEEVKHCEKGKNLVKTVQQYKELPDGRKKGMLNFSEVQKKDVKEFLHIFPDITVETKVFVDDDEDDNVYEGDVCTIQVTISRNQLADGEKAGLVHAPYFPFPKQEAFWIILAQAKDGKITTIDKNGNPNKVIVHNIKFLAPPAGHYEFDLLVKSNAYIGIDETVKISLETKSNSSLPEYHIHPDDAKLDDEPTLFEEMMNTNVEEDSDDDDDDDDSHEDDEMDKKKSVLRQERYVDDSDGDDEDDDDED